MLLRRRPISHTLQLLTSQFGHGGGTHSMYVLRFSGNSSETNLDGEFQTEIRELSLLELLAVNAIQRSPLQTKIFQP